MLDEMSLLFCRRIVGHSDAGSKVGERAIRQRGQIILGVAASEAMDPLELNVDCWGLFLVLWRFCEVGRWGHLADPWLYGHELITSTQVNLGEFVIVVTEATASFHLFNLSADLFLLFLLTLGFGLLT